MLRLFERFVTPGLVEARYALHLSNQGDQERALALADRALTKANQWRPTWGPLPATPAGDRQMILTTQAHILCRMGRYTEALRSAALAKSLHPPAPMPTLVEGLVYFYQGNLEAALRCGEMAINTQPANDPARALICRAKTLNGRFQEAIDIMEYQPVNAAAFFSRDQLEVMHSNRTSHEVVLAMDREVAGVFRPTQFIAIADVCLDAGDTKNMEVALGRAETELGGHPEVRQMYYRLRACCCALNGDAAKAEDNLAQARTLTNEFPSRSSRYEMHRAAGRVALLLGRREEARTQFIAALDLALHPLEKHTTRYWFGRSAEACGRAEEAVSLLSATANDAFTTWMSADAANRLKKSSAARNP
jgi:tetratricopeptide (TPR) repeat protein